MRELPRGVPLFRKEAVLHKTDSLLGEILIPTHRAMDWLVWSVVIVTVLLVGLLFTGQYARRIHAVGWLTTVPGTAKVMSPRDGIVAEVRVQEGTLVSKGDPLLAISTERRSTSDVTVEQKIIGQLREEKASLVRQADLERSLGETEAQQRGMALRDAEASVKKLRQMQALAQRRWQLAEAEAKRNADLAAKGLVARVSVDRSIDAALAAQHEVQEASERMRERKQAAALLKVELAELPLRLEKRLAELQSAVARLDQRITEAESANDAVIYSSISGRVSALAVHVGESVAHGDTLFAIVPEDAELRAELLVPASAAGFLEPGMEVQLRYDAYPYQKFGAYRGIVSMVSRTSLSPQEQTGILHLNEPAYLVIVKPAAGAVTVDGQQVILRAGLTLRADITRDRRRIVDWMLNPLYTALRR